MPSTADPAVRPAPGVADGVGGQPQVSRWVAGRSAVLDRVAALLLGTVAGPVSAVLGLLVRRHDGGRGLIGLPRAGRDGQVFTMWKLRTMRAAAPSGAAGGATITAVDDDRVTPIGRRLRQARLDELPQLWNVLRGEMALIGPRPEDPAHVDPATPAWRAVLAARPGITGPTQLVVAEWEGLVLGGDDHVGRYEREILPVKLAIDRWYVTTAGPGTDVQTAWSMVERYLLRRDDSVIERRVRREVPAAAVVPGRARA